MYFSILIFFTFNVINLISINSQGLCSYEHRQTAFNFFKRHKYNIISVQETHWTIDKQAAIQQNWCGDIIFNNGTKNACGVAILCHSCLDNDLDQSKHDTHGHIWAVKIIIDDTIINLVNI